LNKGARLAGQQTTPRLCGKGMNLSEGYGLWRGWTFCGDLQLVKKLRKNKNGGAGIPRQVGPQDNHTRPKTRGFAIFFETDDQELNLAAQRLVQKNRKASIGSKGKGLVRGGLVVPSRNERTDQGPPAVTKSVKEGGARRGAPDRNLQKRTRKPKMSEQVLKPSQMPKWGDKHP